MTNGHNRHFANTSSDRIVEELSLSGAWLGRFMQGQHSFVHFFFQLSSLTLAPPPSIPIHDGYAQPLTPHSAITHPAHTTHTQLHCPLMKNPCGWYVIGCAWPKARRRASASLLHRHIMCLVRPSRSATHTLCGVFPQVCVGPDESAAHLDRRRRIDL